MSVFSYRSAKRDNFLQCQRFWWFDGLDESTFHDTSLVPRIPRQEKLGKFCAFMQ